MAYNLDLFENFVFTVPSTRWSRRLLATAGFISGLTIYLLLALREQLVWSIIPLLGSVLAFTLPPLVVAVILPRLVPEYPNNWSYFLGVASILLLFGHVGAAVVFDTSDAIVQMGLVTVYLFGFAVLVLTAGTDRFLTIGVLSAVYPLALVGTVHATGPIGLQMVPPIEETALLLGVTGILVVTSVLVHEQLMNVNVPFIDGARLVSGLFQARKEDIDAGYPCEPTVQSLVIDAEDRTTLVAPWIHPGPLQGFGGATVTKDIIDDNSEDGRRFFLKVPATHERDPATTAAANKISEAIVTPETTDKASPLLSRTYEDVTFYGRRFGDKRFVLVEPHFAGDFPLSVIGNHIDPSETLVTDRHVAEPENGRWVTYDSKDAEIIQDGLATFLEELDNTEADYEYRAGAAVDTNGKEIFALVEAVNGQRTLLLGSNENEIGPSLKNMESELNESFSEVVLFSTDTHHDMHDLAVRKPIDTERVRKTIKKAESRCSPARIGLGEETADGMPLLGRQYYALMYTINLITRSFGISLVALYLLLIGYIFFVG